MPLNKQDKRLICSICHNHTHKKCLGEIESDFNVISQNIGNWFCIRCNVDIFSFKQIEANEDFISTIKVAPSKSNMFNTLEELNNLIPLDSLDSDDSNDPLAEIDPDTNFYNSQLYNLTKESRYTDSEPLNNILVTEGMNSGTLSILHTSIRSIPKNLKALEN